MAIPGPATEALGQAAAEAGVFAAVGVIERDQTFGRGTLYCTLVYFTPAGELMGRHRKLKPTASERLIWGEGDGSTMPVFETGIGRMGGLICWENYMPLARMALYGKGVQLYVELDSDVGKRAKGHYVLWCNVGPVNEFHKQAVQPSNQLGHKFRWRSICAGYLTVRL